MQAAIRWDNKVYTFKKLANQDIEHIRELMHKALAADMPDLETLLDGACFEYEVTEV